MTSASRSSGVTTYLGLLLLLLQVVLSGCGDNSRGVESVSVSTAAAGSRAEVTDKAVVDGTGEVYRFAKVSNGAYFFTGSAQERDHILQNFPDFRYEGVAFLRVAAGSGTPVYRFANLSNGGYFYTANEVERDFVLRSRPELRFEGSTFTVADIGTSGAQAVRRLANVANGAYLFTASDAEAAAAIGQGFWRDEGTAFYSPTGLAPLVCPAASVPFNRTCVCTAAGLVYDSASGACVAATPRVCPANAASANGRCICLDPRLVFDDSAQICRTPCPSGSTLTGGTCACVDPGLQFSEQQNTCIRACPANSLRVGAACVCNVTNFIHDTVNNVCVLPPDEGSILTGPPCAGFTDICGGGGGGSGGGGAAGGAAGGDGVGAADGKLNGAVAELWRPLNGGLKRLGVAEVDSASGMVTVKRGSYTGPLWVVFKGSSVASYFDEALGADRTFGGADDLNLLLPSAATQRNFGATVLTEAAFQYALQRWGSPQRTREQNIAAVLTDLRIAEANGFVRDNVNGLLPSSMQLTDISRLPYLIGAVGASRSVPDTPNGRYAIVLASFAISAQTFNQQVVASWRVGGFSVTSTPGRDFTRQLAADLADGSMDARAGANPVSAPDKRVYALSQLDPSLTQFGMTAITTLPAMEVESIRLAVAVYGNQALYQSLYGNNGVPSCQFPVTLCTGCATYCCRRQNSILTVIGQNPEFPSFSSALSCLDPDGSFYPAILLSAPPVPPN